MAENFNDFVQWQLLLSRSSRPEVLYKKGFLKIFAKFTGKHLCQSLLHRCFPVNFCENFKNFFFYEHLRWCLLDTICPANGDKTIARRSQQFQFSAMLISYFFYIIYREWEKERRREKRREGFRVNKDKRNTFMRTQVPWAWKSQKFYLVHCTCKKLFELFV